MTIGGYIVGLAPIGHDLSATVVGPDGRVVLIAEEERYSGCKGGQFAFLPDLLTTVLRDARVDPSAVVGLATAGRPEAWLERNHRTLPFLARARLNHTHVWLDAIRAQLPGLRYEASYRHHEAHAASAFLACPFEHAAVATADGFGDGQSASGWVGRNRRLEPLFDIEFPRSVPYLYRAFATWLGLRGWEREGKLMALASYGRPVHAATIRAELLTGEDLWRPAPRLSKLPCHHIAWAGAISDVFGPPRPPDSNILPVHHDIAASIQAVLEESLAVLLTQLHDRSGLRQCALAGGAFLNSVANGRLARESSFSELFIPPFASDTGLSVGAALALAASLGLPRWRLETAALGPPLDTDTLAAAAREAELESIRLENPAAWVADALVHGAVVGLCEGRAEIGPRALGQRSVLADPRGVQARDVVNRCKYREPWRPFAPAVLAEDASLWLEDVRPCPYMTEVRQWRRPDLTPAVVHVDGTARVQIVDRAHAPGLWEILRHFKKRSGIGVLLNTSLNVQGHPIACTVGDAIRFFLQSGVDELVVAGTRLARRPAMTCEVEPAPLSTNRDGRHLLISFGPAPPNATRALGDAFDRRELPRESLLDGRLDDEATDLPAGVRLVVALPWYLIALPVAAPRLAAKLVRLGERIPGTLALEPNGRLAKLDAWRVGLSAPALDAAPIGDFEVHIRNLSRFVEPNGNMTR